MTLYGVDFSKKLILVEEDGKQYAVEFYTDLFGNIKLNKFFINGKEIKEKVMYTGPNNFESFIGPVIYTLRLIIRKLKHSR